MPKETELDLALEKVCDEASFIAFLEALSKDWYDEQRKEAVDPSPPYGPGANGWENGTIGDFLEAASACALDHLNNPTSTFKWDNPWRQAAAIIYSGKYYE
jgi:hypothetical protein